LEKEDTPHFFSSRVFLIFYSLFSIALDALPCPGLPRPYPALPLPCPVSNFPFAARDRRRKLHKERAMFFFPFAARTGGGSYTWKFFSFCCQGQEEEVTQGTFFPFAARDFIWDMGFRTWTDGQTDRHTL
jgi:hypothetical protein